MPLDIHSVIRANAMPDAPPNAHMLNMAAMGRHHAIARNTMDAFHTAYGSLELEYKKIYRELRADGAPIKWVMPITYRGYTVHCGYVPVYGRNVFAVHEIDADKVYNIRAIIAKRPEEMKQDVEHGIPDLRDVPLIPEHIAPKERLRTPIPVIEPASAAAGAEKTSASDKPPSPLVLAGAMAKRFGRKATGASFRNLYNALEAEYRRHVLREGRLDDLTSEILPITLNGITVRCGYITVGRSQFFGVHQDDADALESIKQIRAADPVGQRQSRREGRT